VVVRSYCYCCKANSCCPRRGLRVQGGRAVGRSEFQMGAVEPLSPAPCAVPCSAASDRPAERADRPPTRRFDDPEHGGVGWCRININQRFGTLTY
jgi:hypothetical protein